MCTNTDNHEIVEQVNAAFSIHSSASPKSTNCIAPETHAIANSGATKLFLKQKMMLPTLR